MRRWRRESAVRDLGLDFQPRRPGLLPVVLLAAAALSCADAGFELRRTGAARHDLAARIDEAQGRLDQQTRAAASANPAAALSAEQAKALRQAEAAIAFDWSRLYRPIDLATGEDVALLAIVPDMAARTLQISGEARDLKAALAFVAGLPGPTLDRASLLSHRIKTDDAQHPVVFEVVAGWTDKP